MKQKSNNFVVAIVLLGLAAASYVSNQLYDWKSGFAPYEAKAPTQFYAGMEKFLSNIGWMTLVQWQADDLDRLTPERAQSLFLKLDSLTNLDPLFVDAYLEGALTLSTYTPDLSLKLLDKAIMMGLGDHWKIPFYAGHIILMKGASARQAEQYFGLALKDKEAPDYVNSALLRAKCLGVNEAPVESMKFWYEYYTSLDATGNQGQRLFAAGQLRGLAEEAATDMDGRLQAASDPATRESVLKDRKWVADAMSDVNAHFPLSKDSGVEPATTQTIMPNI